MGSPPPAWLERPHPIVLFVLIGCAWGGFVGALAIVAPALAVPGLAAFAVAFVAVTISVLTAGALAPVADLRLTALVVAPALAALGAVALAGADGPGPVAAAAVTTALLLFGGAIGAAVGGRIEKPGHLLVVVVASILVDTFSVLHSFGPTAQVVARPTVIALIALPWPVLGTNEISPVLGVGDVVFAALYLAAARRHGLGTVRTAVALGVGLVLTAVVVFATVSAAPALVGMGLAVLVAHPRARKLPPEDRRLGRTILAVLAAAWAVLWLVERL